MPVVADFARGVAQLRATPLDFFCAIPVPSLLAATMPQRSVLLPAKHSAGP